MLYDIVDTESEVKSNRLNNWYINKLESIVGQFPEFEKPKTEEIIFVKEKPILKKYKLLRYSIFPIVLILIIIDESYIRIKELIKNIDESE
jgi:hypothetical protein